MGKKSNSSLRGDSGNKETDRMLKKLRFELGVEQPSKYRTSVAEEARMRRDNNVRKERLNK